VANLDDADRGTSEEWKRIIWMIFEEPDTCKLALGVNLWVRLTQLLARCTQRDARRGLTGSSLSFRWCF